MHTRSILTRGLMALAVCGSLGFGAAQAVATPQAAIRTDECKATGPTVLKPCKCPDGTNGFCDSLNQCNCTT